MYYLTFSLPGVEHLLRRHGFEVERRAGVFPAPFGELELVVATLPGRRESEFRV